MSRIIKRSTPTRTTDNGFAVRGMAGYAFPSGLRVEAEIDYRKHKTRPNGREKRLALLSKLAVDKAIEH